MKGAEVEKRRLERKIFDDKVRARKAGNARERQGVKEGLVDFLGEADLMAGRASGSRLSSGRESKWPSRGEVGKKRRGTARERGEKEGKRGRERETERD